MSNNSIKRITEKKNVKTHICSGSHTYPKNRKGNMKITTKKINMGVLISSSLISKINGIMTMNTRIVAVILNPFMIKGYIKTDECTLGSQKNQNFSVNIFRLGVVSGKIALIINWIRIASARYKRISFISLSFFMYMPIVSRNRVIIHKMKSIR
jgi:hypothetical protein